MQALLSQPRLMDCRRLFLSNYEVYINIGVHDFEKRGEQRVLINVDLFVPLTENTPKKDSLDEVVDYDFMRQSIVQRVAKGHIHCRKPSVMMLPKLCWRTQAFVLYVYQQLSQMFIQIVTPWA